MSFSWKLLGAMVLAVSLAVGGTYIFSTHGIRSGFAAYLSRMRQAQGQELAELLGAYWAQNHSWAGVSRFFAFQVTITFSHGAIRQSGPLGQYILVDNRGKVVACGEPDYMGRTVSQEELRYGIPIVHQGEVVGTLVPVGKVGPLEESFLREVRVASLAGGAMGLAAAAILGAVLAFQLARPLRHLIHATERIAAGELSHRVRIRARDEIGRLARAFNHMAESLERSERARKHLLADIAHELRTPLTVIQGNLEAMLDGVFPLSQESLAPVYEETLQLAELVEDLRELTLAEAGKLPLQREPLDLGQLAERVCEAIRPVAAEEGIHLELELGRGLVVEADPKRIRQVLGNILANALRYSPAGGTVSVSVRREGNGAVVTVRDQGPGIPPEDLPHIFERFYKGDPARSGQGSGLGLAIAKAIVEAHGGRIWAESRLGEGTAVSFSLPLRGDGSSESA